MISSQEIAKLRAVTGAGVIACKQALEEAGGDFERAQKILASNAESIAQKKAERSAKQGLIEGYVHAGKIGVLVELNCESDFVARNAEFKELAHEIAMQIASMNPQDVTVLMEEPYIRDETKTIKNLIDEKIATIGEKIQVKRFLRLELGESEGGCIKKS